MVKKLADAFENMVTPDRQRHSLITPPKSNDALTIMMYQNSGRYRDPKPIQDALAGVSAIELLQDVFHKIQDNNCYSPFSQQ